MMPLAAPVLLMVRTERPTASIMSGIVLKRLPHSGSFTLGIKSKSQGLMSGEYGGWYSTSHCHLASNVHYASDMRPSVVVQNEWCVFTEKVWSLLPQRTVQMVLEEIGVVLACDCRMLGHSMCENHRLSVSNNVATELTWASVALGRPARA